MGAATAASGGRRSEEAAVTAHDEAAPVCWAGQMAASAPAAGDWAGEQWAEAGRGKDLGQRHRGWAAVAAG